MVAMTTAFLHNISINQRLFAHFRPISTILAPLPWQPAKIQAFDWWIQSCKINELIKSPGEMAASDWWIQACTIIYLIKSTNSKEIAKFLTLLLYLQLISPSKTLLTT